ncbi:type II toxin-antitoxin system SpoIISA family toxin [Rossellomorea marisflavi]|uniref:type II toxin-antitoxin system SpoIISA family toxin n=1 Tax=Rossellomorea marisflavi TaxID=189381 RepID=UPI003F9FBB82
MIHAVWNWISSVEMVTYYKWLVWICLMGLVFYTYTYSKNEEKINENIFTIRKIWYLIYLVGAAVYWTYNPFSIFDDWLNYLIVLTIFMGIDAIVFLNLYITKAGSYEVGVLSKTISKNDDYIENNMSLVSNMIHFLNVEGIEVYSGSKEAYIRGLNKVLYSFASREDMKAEIVPFMSMRDKKKSLEGFVNETSSIAKLERNETIYSQDEKTALHPTRIMEEYYVLRVTANRKVIETDCHIISLLVYVYDYAMPDSDWDIEL